MTEKKSTLSISKKAKKPGAKNSAPVSAPATETPELPQPVICPMPMPMPESPEPAEKVEAKQAAPPAPPAPAPKPAFSMVLTDEQQETVDFVRAFCKEFITLEEAAKWDKLEQTPWPLIKKAAEAGLYDFEFIANAVFDPTGLTLPLVLEELAAADPGICMAIVGTCLAVSGIMANGTQDQLFTWAPQCFGTPDKPALAAFCVSEPDAGSDVSALRTKAVYDAETDEWVLNGTKYWITNGGIADVHVVVATVDPALGAKGQASFVVGPNTPGLSQGSKIHKLGIKASHTAEVVLDNVRVPGNQLLGGKEALDRRLENARTGKKSGSQAAMATFEMSRPAVGAMALGVARAALDYALKYAGEREQFGKKIVENQQIAFNLADLYTELDAARLLVWRAAWMSATQQPFTKGEGSMAKKYASQVATRAAYAAVQILGGAGFSCDHPVERYLRDSQIFEIFEGTTNVQRIIISRQLTGLRIS